MKKILLPIIILLLFLSCSQNSKTDFEYGNLWRIESKSGIVSFIFGTAHLYSSSDIQISENVISKLKKCNVLALETDIMNDSDRKRFNEITTPNSLLNWYRVINENYGDELAFMEHELTEISKESNMHLTGLESNKEIYLIMKENSGVKIHEKNLTDEQILDNYQKMSKLYEAESIQKLYEEMKIQSGDKTTKLLVDDRNENWIDNIATLIEKDRTFIAVGAGHLAGKKGVLHLLQKEGYKLKRI
ncbi:uncharacterized protein YbaP (TraB family) [Gramella sp. Hel_I_59]|uniref:TraB/GumN family protein n=1 Tax=Gramella sp. Hel_I_59 TaxID=1249978 RepID=UPI00114D8B80|nr:TraB/GumN family protein [Gramella sp. Hel_I_59]TQI71143.1 uncharacterized protein YbaP (TraB family) [Gramella sp. Hel_I_59]